MAFREDVVAEIVRLHDEELLSVRKIAKKLNVGASTIFKYCASGDIHFEKNGKEFVGNSNKGKRLSEETKRKLSEARKAWILAHPDKSPYLVSHYTRGESYSEKYFREWMEKEGIQFVAQQNLGTYRLDFLVGNIDLEIDGEQHWNDKRVAESDKRRNKYVEEQGLKVIRIRWSHYQKLSQDDKHDFLERLKVALTTDNQLNESFKIDEGKLRKIYGKCKQCGKDIFSRWNKSFCSTDCSNKYNATRLNGMKDLVGYYKKFVEDFNECGSVKMRLAKKYGVSETAIRKRIKRGIKLGYLKEHVENAYRIGGYRLEFIGNLQNKFTIRE